MTQLDGTGEWDLNTYQMNSSISSDQLNVELFVYLFLKQARLNLRIIS